MTARSPDEGGARPPVVVEDPPPDDAVRHLDATGPDLVRAQTKLLGLLQRGDKVNSNLGSRQPRGRWQAVTRLCTRDNREYSIESIRATLMAACALQQRTPSDALVRDITQALHGLANLQQTYRDEGDELFACRLLTLAENVQQALGKYHGATS